MHLYGRGDHEPKLIDQASLEKRLRQSDTSVDADVTPRLLLESGDELGDISVNDGGIRPAMFQGTRRRYELIGLVDEAGEQSVSCRPELSPFVVGPTAEKYGILRSYDALEIVAHGLVEIGVEVDEIVRPFCYTVER